MKVAGCSWRMEVGSRVHERQRNARVTIVVVVRVHCVKLMHPALLDKMGFPKTRNPRMPLHIPTIDDVRVAEAAVRPHVSPAPLIRSYLLEKELGFPEGRRVWIKDYGWTPVGSFKLLGALNWVANNLERIGSRK